MKFTSIIITHWASNEFRSNALRKTLTTLFETTKHLPTERIVIDNGGSIKDSEYLLDLTEKGEINTYIRNHNNLSFGYARNQALRVCNGDYICVADNDIIYNPGWLDACLAVLEAYPHEKIYATPIYNVAHWQPKYWNQKELEVNGKIYRLNRRAGSNCWIMRRKDFEEVGDFPCHRVAGTKWTDMAQAAGYWAAVTPDIMVNDWGFRKGYNLNECKPIKENLHDGEEVYFNDDEYKHTNKDKFFKTQQRFVPRNRKDINV